MAPVSASWAAIPIASQQAEGMNILRQHEPQKSFFRPDKPKNENINDSFILMAKLKESTIRKALSCKEQVQNIYDIMDSFKVKKFQVLEEDATLKIIEQIMTNKINEKSKIVNILYTLKLILPKVKINKKKVYLNKKVRKNSLVNSRIR